MTDKNLKSFYDHVEKAGHLLTPEHARRWTRGVLQTLGVYLGRGTKRSLAKQLPEELADWLTDVFWLLHFRNTEMSSYEFQRRVARRCGNTDAAFARYPVLAVFGGVQQMIPEKLQHQVADSLSPEIRQLWQEAAANGSR